MSGCPKCGCSSYSATVVTPDYREAIEKLAGEDLYATVEQLETLYSACQASEKVARQEHDRLQAQVSELKERKDLFEMKAETYLDDYKEVRESKTNLESAYALLKNAIDKKAITRTKQGFVRDVKEAYAEAEKLMGAK